MKIKSSMATLATAVSFFLAVGTAQAAGNAQNGATLFSSKCQVCHGAQGKNGSAPALNPLPSIFDTMAPNMPPGGSTSSSDVADIKAYLTGLSGGGTPPTAPTTTTQTPATGVTAPTTANVPAATTRTSSSADLLLWAGGVALLGGAVLIRRRKPIAD